MIEFDSIMDVTVENLRKSFSLQPNEYLLVHDLEANNYLAILKEKHLEFVKNNGTIKLAGTNIEFNSANFH